MSLLWQPPPLPSVQTLWPRTRSTPRSKIERTRLLRISLPNRFNPNLIHLSCSRRHSQETPGKRKERNDTMRNPSNPSRRRASPPRTMNDRVDLIARRQPPVVTSPRETSRHCSVSDGTGPRQKPAAPPSYRAFPRHDSTGRRRSLRRIDGVSFVCARVAPSRLNLGSLSHLNSSLAPSPTPRTWG